MWFLDFLSIFFTMAHKDRSIHLSYCAKVAYAKALGPNHTWVVRQAAKVAMYACPGREYIFNATNLTYDDIQELIEYVDTIRNALWDYFRARKIDKL
jgi:hypothetical protein